MFALFSSLLSLVMYGATVYLLVRGIAALEGIRDELRNLRRG